MASMETSILVVIVPGVLLMERGECSNGRGNRQGQLKKHLCIRWKHATRAKPKGGILHRRVWGLRKEKYPLPQVMTSQQRLTATSQHRAAPLLGDFVLRIVEALQHVQIFSGPNHAEKWVKRCNIWRHPPEMHQEAAK